MQVSWNVYKTFFSAAGIRNIIVASLLCVLGCAIDLSTKISLSFWTGDPVFKNVSNATDGEKEAAMGKYIGIVSFFGAALGEYRLRWSRRPTTITCVPLDFICAYKWVREHNSKVKDFLV